LMFQREVAQRITAKPGTREYGPLTVLAGAAFEVRMLFDLAPGAFRPRPNVTSTVTHWSRRPLHEFPVADEGRLRQCLRASFGRRRKTIRNNLRSTLGSEADAMLEQSEIDGERRPEQLSPTDYRRLSASFGSDAL
jgi:16S rRNA (adenine1518-N6/adenine1519-N6)-dimethyltransferase